MPPQQYGPFVDVAVRGDSFVDEALVEFESSATIKCWRSTRGAHLLAKMLTYTSSRLVVNPPSDPGNLEPFLIRELKLRGEKKSADVKSIRECNCETPFRESMILRR